MGHPSHQFFLNQLFYLLLFFSPPLCVLERKLQDMEADSSSPVNRLNLQFVQKNLIAWKAGTSEAMGKAGVLRVPSHPPHNWGLCDMKMMKRAWASPDRSSPEGMEVRAGFLHTPEELASCSWHLGKCYKTLRSIRAMLINVNSLPQGIIPFSRKLASN